MSDIITSSGGVVEYKPADLEVNLDDTSSLFDDSRAVVPQALREREESNYDPTWKAHRTMRVNSGRLEWSFPTTAKERAEGKEPFPEINPNDVFVGIRGIILDMRYGLSMIESNGSSSTTICRTTMMDETLGGTTRRVKSSHPLEFPVTQIHQSKKEPHQLNGSLRNKPHITLYGSRPPIGEEGGEVRTCASCVAAGEHYVGSVDKFLDPSSNIPTCRMTGYVMMCVFQLGKANYSKMFNGGAPEVEWMNIEDAGLTTERDGQIVPLARPFIVKLEGITKVQHWSIGSGQYCRDVITSGNKCFLPPEIYSAGDYQKYLTDPQFYGKRHRTLANGKVGYLQVTEMFTGQLRKEEYGATHIPVFSPVRDQAVIDAGCGWDSSKWLATAIQTLQFERELAKGAASEEAFMNNLAIASSGSSRVQEALSAVPVADRDETEEFVATPDVPATPPAAGKWESRKKAAFTGPPKPSEAE